MRTRSSSNLVGNSSSNPTTSNPKRRNRRRSNQRVEPFALEESPVVTMADQRTMAELLRAPTEGYAEAIVVPPILAEHFELKHSLINMMTSDQFFGLEKDNPHDHIRWFNKITSTIKYKDVPNHAIKLMLFPFSLAGAARRWLEKEPPPPPPRSITTWDDLVSKFINEFFPPSRTTNLRNEISNFQQKFDESFHEAWDRYKDLLRACPHHGFTELHQLDTFYNALNPSDQDSLNSAAGGNLLERSTQDVLTIIENKSNCLTADGNTFPEYQDNIQGYLFSSAVTTNQGNALYVLKTTALPRVRESLPSNNIANPKGELKAITTQSGLVSSDGPAVQYLIHSLIRRRMNLDPRYPHIPYPSRMNQEKQKEKDEEKAYELAYTPLNENCSAVILKKLPEKLGDPGKFLIPCGFNELKCKALADLGASINLMPLSVWKELGLPELISTQMTLELANRDICTPKGIARDVFVPVRNFTFLVDFVIVNYESDPRVPLILGRPFLRTARALIDVHGEEMILRDGNERLILNMRNDTSSYSNKPHQESINMIYVYNVSHEEYREDLFATNHPSGNPTSSLTSYPDLTSPEVNDDIFDLEEDIIENFLNLDKTKDLPQSDLIWEEFKAYLVSNSFPPGNSNPSSLLPPFHNSLSGSTISSSPSLPISEISDYFLEEFADELALMSFSPGNDDLPFDAKSDLREIEYFLNHDPIKEMDSILKYSVDGNSLDDNLIDTISEMFIDEHALDYSFPPLWDEYDDELFDLETDFSEVDALPSTDNEDKIFNPGILIHENLFEVTNLATLEKNVKKATNTSLILEDFNPPLYELPFHKEVSNSLIKGDSLGIFFDTGILTEGIEEDYGEDIRTLDVPCLHFYPP
ncbi:reverse transcriptase domain-containing protein [Tanacetum coccineum]